MTIDDLRALSEQATPGPWGPAESGDGTTDPDKADSVTRFLGWDIPQLEQSERRMFANGHDARFIVAAVNWVRSALADEQQP